MGGHFLCVWVEDGAGVARGGEGGVGSARGKKRVGWW